MASSIAKFRRGSVAVNAAAAAVQIDAAQFVVQRATTATSPPIDIYLGGAADLVRQSGEGWCAPWILELFVVRLVAEVELYARSVLVGLVGVCPLAFGAARRKHVSLAAVDYYAGSDRAFAVVDHEALSGSGEIIRATLQLTGLDLKKSAAVQAALSGYDRVCQLRHAIVHQTGRVGIHNFLELDLPLTHPSPASVAISTLRFQDLVAACHSAVRTCNQYIFDETCVRWITDGTLTLRWVDDSARFGDLCRLLVSRIDLNNVVVEDLYRGIGGAV